MENSFITLQYSFCDIRRFLENSGTDVVWPLPNWDAPLESRHFVKFFGRMDKRIKNVPQIFEDQNYFIEGGGGIKFHQLEHVPFAVLENAFRKRLFFDRLCGVRFQVGLRYLKSKILLPENFSDQEKAEQLAADLLLQIPIRVRNLADEPGEITNFLKAGRKLAQLYQKATESQQPKTENIEYVKHGSLCIFIQNPGKPVIPVGKNWSEPLVLENGISLITGIPKVEDRIYVFLLNIGGSNDDNYHTKIREITLRLHFEYQNFKLFLQFVQDSRIILRETEIEKFVKKARRFHKKSLELKNERGELYDRIYPFFEFLFPGESERLFKILQEKYPSIYNAVFEILDQKPGNTYELETDPTGFSWITEKIKLPVIAPMPGKNQVFCAFDYTDIDYFKAFNRHLTTYNRSLIRSGKQSLTIWNRKDDIKPGESDEQVVYNKLNSTYLSVFFLSANFFEAESNYELFEHAKMLALNHQMIVLCVILTPLDAEDLDFSGIILMNEPRFPISELTGSLQEKTWIELKKFVQFIMKGF